MPLIQRVLREVPWIIGLRAAALLAGRGLPLFVTAARPLVDLEQAIERGWRPVPVGQRTRRKGVRHDDGLLPELRQNVLPHPVPEGWGSVVRRLASLLSIYRPQGRSPTQEKDVAMAAGALHRMLVRVDAPELGRMGIDVREFLGVPPLVVAQRVGPPAAKDLVVVARPHEVHLGRVERVAVGVLDGTVYGAVPAHVSVAMAVSEQERVTLAVRRHARPLARREACDRLGHGDLAQGRFVRLPAPEGGGEHVVVQCVHLMGRQVLGRPQVAGISHVKVPARSRRDSGSLRVSSRTVLQQQRFCPAIGSQACRVDMEHLMGFLDRPVAEEEPERPAAIHRDGRQLREPAHAPGENVVDSRVRLEHAPVGVRPQAQAPAGMQAFAPWNRARGRVVLAPVRPRRVVGHPDAIRSVDRHAGMKLRLVAGCDGNRLARALAVE